MTNDLADFEARLAHAHDRFFPDRARWELRTEALRLLQERDHGGRTEEADRLLNALRLLGGLGPNLLDRLALRVLHSGPSSDADEALLRRLRERAGRGEVALTDAQSRSLATNLARKSH